MIDITGLTLEELGNLRMQVDDLLQIKRAERVVSARRDILGIVKQIGVPLEDLMERPDVWEKRSTPPVRIEHPSVPGLAWAGRGRRPNWIKDLLATGKSIEELKAPGA